MSEEKKTILRLNEILKRAPYQLNKPFESDSEIIELGGARIALSTDTLIEEIRLFHHPYVIGWHSAMMSLSDLFATGSTAKGLLISVTRAKETDKDFLIELMKGVQDCCEFHETYVLGGDLNESDVLSITTTGIGAQEANTVMRSGIMVGDGVFVTENVGIGNVQALLRLSGNYSVDEYDPNLLPKITQKQLDALKSNANSAIDTSDGLVIALLDLLDQNLDLNIHVDVSMIPYHTSVSEIEENLGIPRITFAGGEVGDYGLLFTAPMELEEELSKWGVKRIGIVSRGKGKLFLDEKQIEPYAQEIHHLRDTPQTYISKLLEVLT